MRPRPPDVSGVLAAAPLPLVLTTTDARVLFTNRAMQRLVGVPADQLTGRFLAEFAGPPHGRLRRLAAVAAAANHPITTEVSFSLGRRRSIAVRVVVARGAATGGDAFLVWQVTSSPTAHVLPEPPGGGPRDAGPPDDEPVAPAPEPAVDDIDEVMASDAHVLTLEMIRTSPDRPVEEVAERLAALAGKAFRGRPLRISLDVASPVPVAAATDPVATLAVQAEVEVGGGPVTASAAGTVVVADLATDPRFGGAGAEIHRRLGVSSALAAPLRRGDAVVGSLVVYCDGAGAFGDEDVWLADWVAAVVGGVLEACVRYNAAATESRQLRTAMASRAVIEQAKGILMARHRADEDAAFSMLRVESQTHNRPLRDVARSVVDEACGGPAAGPRAEQGPDGATDGDVAPSSG
ncbi:ANTAR domain-containing protein [Kineosporia sp. A_224]|uniref:ANTAR domain-containing protein n=1 Tax=Kineosporia sp. A_224 TaxID=1962180 RepID=UPI00130475EC|nr:ANTAR domain-containing protein [Kineosporia sp. A_224]